MDIKLTMQHSSQVVLKAILPIDIPDALHANLKKFLSHQVINEHFNCSIFGGTSNDLPGMTTVTRIYTFKNYKDACEGYKFITAQITAMRLCGGLREAEVEL